jgi:hypothetical protein
VAQRFHSLAILAMLVVGLGLGNAHILGPTSTHGMLALLFFIAGSHAMGFVPGGRDPAICSGIGLGAGQCSVSTAIAAAAHGDECHPIALGRRWENVRRI